MDSVNKGELIVTKDNTIQKVLIDIPDTAGVGWFAKRGDEVLVLVCMAETSFCKNARGLTQVVQNYYLILK